MNCQAMVSKLGALGAFRARVVFGQCRSENVLYLDEQQTVAEHLLRFCDRVQFGGHVLVTVPEHRLSRESKAIQLAWRGKRYIIVHS